jgi:hypothetical protein
MKKTLLFAALLSVGACKKTKIKECDDFMATAEKIQKCDTLPQSTRDSLAKALDTMRDGLKQADGAPQSQIDLVARTCKDQHDTILRVYEKSAPECLK